MTVPVIARAPAQTGCTSGSPERLRSRLGLRSRVRLRALRLALTAEKAFRGLGLISVASGW